MSVTRINQFLALPGREKNLEQQLGTVIPVIESAAGCLSCQLLRSRKDPARFIVIEVWDDVEAHQESLATIRPDVFEAMKMHLAAPPTGEYYDYCHVR